jgi:hypothetical protein
VPSPSDVELFPVPESPDVGLCSAHLLLTIMVDSVSIVHSAYKSSIVLLLYIFSGLCSRALSSDKSSTNVLDL